MTKHIAEMLIEANKTISKLSEKAANTTTLSSDRQMYVNELNDVIRQLDSIVEKLENS